MEDKILIKSLKIFAYHGVWEDEKINGQSFVIDCTLFVDRESYRFSDDLSTTISYSEVSQLIKSKMLEKKYNLMECAAENVAKSLFDKFSMLKKIEITLKKPDAPVDFDFDYMAVSIFRKREDFID